MKNRKKLQSVLSMALVLLLILSSCAVLVGAGRAQPENPIGKRQEQLRPETASGSGSLWGENGENIGENGNGEAQEETQPPETTEPPDTTPTTPPDSTRPTDPDETDPTEETQDPTEDPQDPTEETKDPTENTDPNTDPDNPDDGQDDNQGGDSDKDNQGGDSDTDDPNKGNNGGDGDDGGDGGKGDNPSDDDTPRIYTDLKNNAYYTKSDLPDGNLGFLAYPLGKGNLSVKVILQNSNTSANGQVLESSDGKSYTAPLVFNEVSYITLILKQDGQNIGQVRFRISYYADKANEDNPEVGDYPPTIITSLDGETNLDFTTQHLTFWVKATANPSGKTIYSNQIQVWLDGELQTKQSGDARPEYDLYFPLPNIEGTYNHVIKVLAWDGNGNSTYKYYNVTFTHIPEGVRNGKATVVLDATAAGLGVMARGEVDILSGETVAAAVIEFLTLYGYSPTYDGTAENAFYLRKITSSDIGRYSFIPPKLQEMLERDGATFTGRPNRDSLGEFDYTRGSGWMYAINGDVYPGRSMSLYPVQPGMTIYLRFTLAYGKDIGGFMDDGDPHGTLRSYCRMWINDNFNGLELAHDFQETDRQEPTATEDGYIDYTCSRCHDTKRETLPATGEETDPTDPSTEPTDPSTEPTDPSTEPTDPPTEPDPATEPEEPKEPDPEEPDGE